MRVWRWPNVSADFYPGQSRPQFFNLAAFSPTPVGAGRFGNAGVGILQGPERRRWQIGREGRSHPRWFGLALFADENSQAWIISRSTYGFEPEGRRFESFRAHQ
jgi:hypothetical protein